MSKTAVYLDGLITFLNIEHAARDMVYLLAVEHITIGGDGYTAVINAQRVVSRTLFLNGGSSSCIKRFRQISIFQVQLIAR